MYAHTRPASGVRSCSQRCSRPVTSQQAKLGLSTEDLPTKTWEDWQPGVRAIYTPVRAVPRLALARRSLSCCAYKGESDVGTCVPSQKTFIPARWDCQSLDMAAADPILKSLPRPEWCRVKPRGIFRMSSFFTFNVQKFGL